MTNSLPSGVETIGTIDVRLVETSRTLRKSAPFDCWDMNDMNIFDVDMLADEVEINNMFGVLVSYRVGREVDRCCSICFLR
jgi:hypothetical protein